MNFLFIASLVITVVAASDRVCKPHKTFKNYCNTCVCAKDGITFACTKMMCDEKIWNEDGTMKDMPNSADDSNKKVCEPRSIFKDYCNTCLCSDDGSYYACTRQACPRDVFNKDGSFKVQPRSTLSGSVPVSTPGKQVCVPRSTFKHYCNTCWCGKDGTTFACTKMFCDQRIFNEDGSFKVKPSLPVTKTNKQVCVPHSAFKIDCNHCTCSSDGMNYACTKMLC